MTLHCTVQVEIGPPGGEGRQAVAAVIDRPDELAPETLGLTLAEAHALLRDVQARVGAAVREFQVYIRRNAGSGVDYGERYRAGERISSGFVESAINQVVAKRFSKRQSVRWTRRGAHLTLQTRTRVLNGDLDVAFRRRWPGFRAERAA